MFQFTHTAHEIGGTVLVASYDSLEFLSLAANTMPLPVQRAVQQSQKFKGEAVIAVAWPSGFLGSFVGNLARNDARGVLIANSGDPHWPHRVRLLANWKRENSHSVRPVRVSRIRYKALCSLDADYLSDKYNENSNKNGMKLLELSKFVTVMEENKRF